MCNGVEVAPCFVSYAGCIALLPGPRLFTLFYVLKNGKMALWDSNSVMATSIIGSNSKDSMCECVVLPN